MKFSVLNFIATAEFSFLEALGDGQLNKAEEKKKPEICPGFFNSKDMCFKLS
jgi:hypothetical protein